jgi:hypothetical protein
MEVLSTKNEDQTAVLTITLAEDSHKFEVWQEGNEALVEFQECCSWRGEIRNSPRDPVVYKELVLSEEMTNLLDEWGVESVRRAEQKV